ncbi:hypothetical protein H6P81_005247 [Aristolochia fimbriata]|uniref:Reverse transcriptase zinc-binding domain-containing protein n=1 Tax=Aristolochia fimbriata TaxID=158543 RepID=A0AAV7EYE1_ARIFI|nr:hypothetical protein H6P81_005247 [Aristolochia fimbriata]
MEPNIRYHVRSGTQVRLWQDCWMRESLLSSLFPSLFSVAGDQLITMSKANAKQRNNWNLNFRRHLADNEATEAATLIQLLESTYIAENGSDEVVWKPCTSATHPNTTAIRRNATANEAWKLVASKRVQHLIWTAVNRKNLTCDELKKRGQVIINNMCRLCGDKLETCRHMLLHCKYNKCVWAAIPQTRAPSTRLSNSGRGVFCPFVRNMRAFENKSSGKQSLTGKCIKGNPGQARIGGIFKDHLGRTLLTYSQDLLKFGGPLWIEDGSSLVIGWGSKGPIHGS